MDKYIEKRVLFPQEAEYIFRGILEIYGLEETEEEINRYTKLDEDTRAMILRDLIQDISKGEVDKDAIKKILVEDLDMPLNLAEKATKSIETRLLPLLIVTPEAKFDDPVFREEISKKVFPNEDGVVMPYIKAPKIPVVERNYEVTKREKKFTEEVKKSIQEQESRPIESKITEGTPKEEKSGPDSYREPVE